MQAISAYGMALVRQIEQSSPLSKSVREAFLAVPRHAFIEAPSGVEDEQWLCQVYQDVAVVIKQDERGRPLSSSSQPSIMACMLDALEVQPGMHILEIGTGSGYNAALLAHLVGDPARVVTIDIDQQMTALASSRIERVVGPGMMIVTGDGRQGVPEYGPYDRIIATASAFPVPPAWIAQLAVHGRLILDLRGEIGGGLMVITKHADGNATGHFLTVKETISFMGLRASVQGRSRAEVFELPSWQEQRLYASGTSEHACASHFSSYERFRGEEDAFNVWTQCLFPSLSIKWIRREKRTLARLREERSQSVLVIEPRGAEMGIAEYGVRPLWEDIVQAYRTWLRLGKPGRACLTLLMTPAGQEMRIAHDTEPLTLLIR